jgi:hypothetical protein
LLNADEFEKIQLELASLRGVAHGLGDALHGRVHNQSVQSVEKRLEKAKTRVFSKQSKKAVG